MTGTIINVITILIGGFIGIAIKKRINEKTFQSIIQVVALFTLFLGVQMALKVEHVLVLILSLIIGTLIGEWLDLEAKVSRLNRSLKTLLPTTSNQFNEALTTSFLLFCMGSMTIMGAIDEGMGNGSQLLITKAILDGFSAMALASALGYGVLFSVIPLLVYQGGITWIAWLSGSIISISLLNNITAVGGVLLIGIGLNLLNLTKIRILNMILAIVIAIPLIIIYQYFF